MELHKIPDVFQSKIRLAIIAGLISGEKSFNEIKEVTQATDGNLSVHLAKLEELDYITACKQFVGKKPRTTYTITDKGRSEFIDYVRLLETIVRKNST